MNAEKKIIVGNTLKAKKCSGKSFAEHKRRAGAYRVEHSIKSEINRVKNSASVRGLQNERRECELKQQSTQDYPWIDTPFVRAHQPGQADENQDAENADETVHDKHKGKM